jgi:DNA polymerase-1
MKHKIFNEESVFEKFGVKPNQIRDMLALVGDTSDNIPGIPKVGQKTAAKWLNEYGDLNSIKENAESIKGVVGENLRNALDDLDRNIELVSLKNDIDINQSFEDLLAFNPNEEELDKIFAELEFKAVGKNKEKEAPKKDSKYETILDEKALKAWIAKINKSKAFAIDTETDSVNTVSANLIGISLSVSENEGCYIPIAHSYEDCPKQLGLNYIVENLGPAIEKNQDKAYRTKSKI